MPLHKSEPTECAPTVNQHVNYGCSVLIIRFIVMHEPQCSFIVGNKGATVIQGTSTEGGWVGEYPHKVPTLLQGNKTAYSKSNMVAHYCKLRTQDNRIANSVAA